MNRRRRVFTYLIRAGILIEMMILAGCSPSCTNSNNSPAVTPSFTLAFRDTNGFLHVRWSADGQTWKDPDTFPTNRVSMDQGPGFGGTPNGLSQLLVFNTGADLFRLSSLGPAEWGTGAAQPLQTNVNPNSPVSVEFIGSGNWLLAHRTGNAGVLRTWDGTSTTTTVITPPGTLGSLCPSDGFSGPIGPKVIQFNGKVLVAFCQRDNSGGESIQLLPGTLASNGTVTFATQVPFAATRQGFDAPVAKIYALAHDGTNFLIATVAPESSQPGPLTTFGLLIFSSPDGQNWTFVTQTSKSSGLNISARNTPLAIAAMPRSNASALIQVAQVAGSAVKPNLWEFNGSTWTDRSNNNPFGVSAPPGLDAQAGFAFRVNGTP